MSVTQLVQATTVAFSAYSGSGAVSLNGTVMPAPAGYSVGTDLVIAILYRASGVTINGNATLSDAGYTQDFQWGTGTLQFNLWHGLISGLAGSATLTEAQATVGGVLIQLVYRFATNQSPTEHTTTGGVAGTSPSISAVAGGSGTADALYIGGQGSTSIALTPAPGSLYGYDYNNHGCAVARMIYSNVTGAPALTASPSPATSTWVLWDGVLVGTGNTSPFLSVIAAPTAHMVRTAGLPIDVAAPRQSDNKAAYLPTARIY